MLSRLYSATCIGIDAYLVEIEVDVRNGMPHFTIVGLPDQAVRESKERVRTALRNSDFLTTPKKTTINLAPADLKKEGPAFDLAIALGLLASSDFLKRGKLRQYLFAGELALDGSLRPIKGALPMAQLAYRKQLTLIVPEENAGEASLQHGVTVLAAPSLKLVVQAINEEGTLNQITHQWNNSQSDTISAEGGDFAEIKGQFHAKRAAEVAASGGHNLLLIGPPGAGKTMIARRIPALLPNLAPDEYLEIAKIRSASGLSSSSSPPSFKRPFRSPHHTISQIGLVGGGSVPRPGEITLAHGGLLFLDEFPEFRRDAIEALRAPMEEGCILIARAKMNLLFPAQFLTVCAMNPCPCGYLTSSKRPCRCTVTQIQKYHQKISGPMLDRIDLHVEIPAIEYKELASCAKGESSSEIRKRVIDARSVQAKRFKDQPEKTNALMSPKDIRTFCMVTSDGKQLLERAMKELQLSARGYHKILKIGRTIADLARTELVESPHIAEAIQYRTLDRNWFG